MTFVRSGLLPSDSLRSHIFVAALGFEKRATHASRMYCAWASHKLALAFPHQDIFSYEQNRVYFEKSGFFVADYSDRAWFDRCASMLDAALRDAKGLDTKVFDFCVDISSMSRPMIADVLLLLRRLALKIDRPISAKLLYSPATYVPPPTIDGPIVKSEPVVPEFAGWSIASGAPTVAVVGLGYEADFALGTWEYLEATSLVAFFPTGEDPRYDAAVEKANEQVLKQIGAAQVWRYRVDDPVQLFIVLNTLVSGYVGVARPIVIPFGPKIFAVTAMVVALVHHPAVTVWRVSGDQDAFPIDREPNGKVVVVDIEISP